MSEENKAVVGKFYEEVFNKGNINAIDQICDPKVVDHTPAPGQSGKGVAALKESMAELRAGFPDLKITVEDVVAEKDIVVARFSAVGTHKGTFMGAPATGKKISVQGLDMIRVKNGKAKEVWHYGNEGMALMQIGVKPPI